MNKAIIIIGIFLIVTVGLLLSLSEPKPMSEHSEPPAAALSLAFLDIGQGDATFIEFGDGTQMLIDCAIDARIIESLGTVMDFYDRTLEYLVVTHPDLDHYGGCVDVLHRFDVQTIIHNGDAKSGTYWEEYWFALHDEGAEIIHLKEQDVWHIASTTLHWMYPDHNLSQDTRIPGAEKETGPNNASIVLKLTHGDIDVLLIGDAEKEQEEYLIETYGDQLDVEILKAGHHGAAGSSIQEFIDITTPEHTVFSAGAENHYGHPSPRIIKRVERAGSAVWRTDIHGDILMSIQDGILLINGEPYVDQKTDTAAHTSSTQSGTD